MEGMGLAAYRGLHSLHACVFPPLALCHDTQREKKTIIVVHIIVFLLGLLIALSTLFSTIKQTVLPGHKNVRLSRAVFRTTFRLFRLVIVRIPSDTARDTLWAFYAPLSVMLLPLAWVILLMIGFLGGE